MPCSHACAARFTRHSFDSASRRSRVRIQRCGAAGNCLRPAQRARSAGMLPACVDAVRFHLRASKTLNMALPNCTRNRTKSNAAK
jgi:hypothetical protein